MWSVLYKTDRIRREDFLTREGAIRGQEKIIRTKSPFWTALVRERDAPANALDADAKAL